MKEKFLNVQDQYKFPMGQLIYEQEPEAEVTFKLHNRKRNMRIADYVSAEELQQYYDSLREVEVSAEEIEILKNQHPNRYTQQYLGYLATFRLPEINVSIDADTDDLTASTTAPWNASSLWEIPILSAIPELYYPRFIEANGGNLEQVYNEGDRRLDQTIALMKQNPEIRFAEFGTRRRFSSSWQSHTVERFATECPDNLIGTSNPWLAHQYQIPASGTNAHELAMVYAALEETRGGNPLDGQNRVIEDWLERFPTMPVVLIDTFTSDATLAGLTTEQISTIESYRIDSGDEYEVGHKVIQFLKHNDIDPSTRTLFFSNSLTPEKAAEIAEEFRGAINVIFGIGGGAVNNMGFDSDHSLPGMNIVAKAVAVNGIGTVKLSDDKGKHTGSTEDVTRYKQLVDSLQPDRSLYV